MGLYISYWYQFRSGVSWTLLIYAVIDLSPLTLWIDCSFLSHARTVVRECCKGDDESQWERGKFDPPPPKTPQPMVAKICVGN